MKIGYKTVIDGRIETHEPVRGGVTPCCERMSEAWSGNAVVFSEARYAYSQSGPPVAQIAYASSDYDGGLDHVYYPIDFCPFCGARIECVEQQRVKVVEETVAEVVTQKKVVRREVPVCGT